MSRVNCQPSTPNNCMFPFVSLRPRRSAAPWDFMTARIDPLHHHSALTNDFKLAISGIMQPAKIRPSDMLQQAEPQETQGEKYCKRGSLLKCRVSVFHNRMLSQGSSLALWLTLYTVGTSFSYNIQDSLSLLLCLLLISALSLSTI